MHRPTDDLRSERRSWIPRGRAGGCVALALIVLATACAERDSSATSDGDADATRVEIERALDHGLTAGAALADSIVERLRPVPLMRPGEEAALRRYSNAQHVARARALGVRAADSAALARLVEEGRLVRLEAETDHWVLRDLRFSAPLVTPDTRALLVEIAERFQAELRERGLPPLRLEITSALRTPEEQARLRRTNPNAAAGTSAHEFGTTVDIAYSAFPPPAELPRALLADAPEWLRPDIERAARAMIDAAAARKSRELKALLGEVLRELQSEGAVLVTLERQQPVYHITVARGA